MLQSRTSVEAIMTFYCDFNLCYHIYYIFITQISTLAFIAHEFLVKMRRDCLDWKV